MKERGMLFKDEMVRAILEGRKTQTRRVVKRWEDDRLPGFVAGAMEGSCPYGKPCDRLWVRETWSDVNLQGAPGIAYRADDDVRDLMAEPRFHDEDGAFNYNDERVRPYHFAVWSEDLLSGAEGRWRPSIHMPRWASRITLEITGVRVERLQDISEEDAKAEGAQHFPELPGRSPYGQDGRWSMGQPTSVDQCLSSPRWAFANYFCKIAGKAPKGIHDPRPWDANPWVWVIEFRRIES